MKLQVEWSELLRLLKRHGVRYLVVGGMAVAAHGRERYTKDLDLFVEPSERNAQRLGLALADFGFPKTAREWRRMADHYQILKLGREPNRIGLLTSIAGVGFAEAWRSVLESGRRSDTSRSSGSRRCARTKRRQADPSISSISHCSTSCPPLLQLQPAIRARAGLERRLRATGRARVAAEIDLGRALAIERRAPVSAQQLGDLR